MKEGKIIRTSTNGEKIDRAILYWRKYDSEYMWWDKRSNRLEKFYMFPWKVKTGLPENIETGMVLFKTLETRKREIEGIRCEINGKEDEGTTLMLFAPPVIFINEETEEGRDFPLLNLEALREDGETMFLYEDLFTMAEMTVDCSSPIELCGIPVSKENPLEHISDDGNYDLDGIRTWPKYLTLRNGTVVPFEAMEVDEEE